MVTKDGDVNVLEYKLKPFSKLEVILSGDTLLGIAIHLAKQTDAEELEKELGLNEFAPAPVPDASGEILGIAYPERGILFALAPIESDKDGTKVLQIILEPISAEPFVYRARYGTRNELLLALADLAQARKLDPRNAEIHWLESRAPAYSRTTHHKFESHQRCHQVGLGRSSFWTTEGRNPRRTRPS